MKGILDNVLVFAATAHQGQTRKYKPEPYISHPIRVMELCKQYSDNIAMLSAALLHDVLEDTAITADELDRFLRANMTPEVARETFSNVIALTDVYIKKDYPQFNRKTRKKMELERLTMIPPDAQTIKYADIIDNSSEIAIHDPQFSHVLLKEYRQVLKRLDKGNPELRERAMQAANR